MIEGSCSIEKLMSRNVGLRRKLSEEFYQNSILNISKEIPIKFWILKGFSERLLKINSMLSLDHGFIRKLSTNCTPGKSTTTILKKLLSRLNKIS